MLIPMSEVLNAYGRVPDGCLHVGAHRGEEAESYSDAGIKDVVWFEANPAMIEPLRTHVEPYGHEVIEACLSDTAGGTATFHITDSANRSNDGQSSSLLELGTHRTVHPDVKVVREITVTLSTLDGIMATRPPISGGWMLNGDIQCGELPMLKGAVGTLPFVDVMYLESNLDQLYQGCAILPELDAWLVERGFECQGVVLAGCSRRDCSQGSPRWCGWGDGLWIRTDDPRPFHETHPDDAADWYR